MFIEISKRDILLIVNWFLRYYFGLLSIAQQKNGHMTIAHALKYYRKISNRKTNTLYGWQFKICHQPYMFILRNQFQPDNIKRGRDIEINFIEWKWQTYFSYYHIWLENLLIFFVIFIISMITLTLMFYC